MNFRKIVFVSLSAFLLFACGSDKAPSMDDFSWLIGKWIGKSSDNTVFHERWYSESEKIMIGIGRATVGTDTIFAETLKIEKIENSFYYIATVPANDGPVLFKAIEMVDGKLIFENKEHDFPQVIKYEMEENVLHVTLEGKHEGQNAREEIYYQRTK
jgi:hypothetical protein